MTRILTLLALAVTAVATVTTAAQHQMPPGHAHADMNTRGAHAMGFDQALGTHHFMLTPAGGRIVIQANDAADADTSARIATHLQTIARRFKDGDFAMPEETHAETPDGVAGLIRLKAHVDYAFEPLPAGGQVVITAHTADALASVHEFLQYQIREHHTGDPLTVVK